MAWVSLGCGVSPLWRRPGPLLGNGGDSFGCDGGPLWWWVVFFGGGPRCQPGFPSKTATSFLGGAPVGHLRQRQWSHGGDGGLPWRQPGYPSITAAGALGLTSRGGRGPFGLALLDETLRRYRHCPQRRPLFGGAPFKDGPSAAAPWRRRPLRLMWVASAWLRGGVGGSQLGCHRPWQVRWIELQP